MGCHLDPKAICCEVFLSVADLQASIEAFLKAWNQALEPFVRTATAESLQERPARRRRALEQMQRVCAIPKSRNPKK
jgi:hypothetical protein